MAVRHHENNGMESSASWGVQDAELGKVKTGFPDVGSVLFHKKAFGLTDFLVGVLLQ